MKEEEINGPTELRDETINSEDEIEDDVCYYSFIMYFLLSLIITLIFFFLE